jgi:hypothetical protein
MPFFVPALFYWFRFRAVLLSDSIFLTLHSLNVLAFFTALLLLLRFTRFAFTALLYPLGLYCSALTAWPLLLGFIRLALSAWLYPLGFTRLAFTARLLLLGFSSLALTTSGFFTVPNNPSQPLSRHSDHKITAHGLLANSLMLADYCLCVQYNLQYHERINTRSGEV